MTINQVSRSSGSHYIQPIKKVQDTLATEHINPVQSISQEQIHSQENITDINKQHSKITDKSTGISNAQHILSAQINQNIVNKTQNISSEEDNIAPNVTDESVDVNYEQQGTEDSQDINNITQNNINKKSDVTLDTINNTLEKIRDQVTAASEATSDDYLEFSQDQINQLLEQLELDLKELNIGHDLKSLGLENIDVTNDNSIENSLEAINDAIGMISYKKENPLGLSNSVEDKIASDLEKLYALGTTAADINIPGYKELLQEEVDRIKRNINDTLEDTGVTLDDLGINDFDVTEEFSLDTLHNAMETLTGEKSTLGEEEINKDTEEYTDNSQSDSTPTLSDNEAWQEVLNKFTNFSKRYQYQTYQNMLNLFTGGYSQVATTFNMFS
ncbi:MAG: hypothetical protein ATN32_00830 [Candidatus Epulonipiscium fishelsonii]|nr:MAG: hypothetical protein ATN32_00830 [Epulopiscium sp. AS2M-Bin002]